MLWSPWFDQVVAEWFSEVKGPVLGPGGSELGGAAQGLAGQVALGTACLLIATSHRCLFRAEVRPQTPPLISWEF